MKRKSNFQTLIGKSWRIIVGIVVVNLIFMLFPMALEAATYYSRVAAFSFATAAANWSTSRTGGTLVNYPGTTHNYVIQTGNNVTIGANQTAVAITVESGGTLTIGGNFTITSPLTINLGGTMTVTTRRLTMAGNLINNGAITITTGRLIRNTFTLTNSGSITMGAGQFTATSGAFTNEAAGTMTVTGAATITLGTGNFVNNNTSASVNFGSSNVGLTGTTRSVGGFVTTGAVTPSNASGTITITGNINGAAFTKSGAGTINMGTGLTHTFTGIFALGTTVGSVVNGGSSTINVNVNGSAWTGTGSLFTPGTGTVNFGGTAQTLSATGTQTFYNLTLSNSGTKTINTTTVNNILSMEGTATASAAPTYGTNATLRYNTATSRTVGVEWITPFAATGGVIIDNTGAIITNGNKVFNQDVPLTINSGATLSPAAGNTFSFGGDFINSGTWTPSTGDVTIALDRVSQNIGSLSTSGTVNMTKATGAATFTGNINCGTLSLGAAGTLNLGSGLTHVITGGLAGTAGTLNGNSSTLRIGGAVTASIAFNANTGTVDYNGSGAQTIPGVTYYNLQTSTADTKTLGGDTVVEGVFTNNSGATFAPATFVFTLSGAGTPLVNNGTFTPGTSTISFSSASSTNVPALNYYNLTLTGGPRVLAGSGTIGIEGLFTPGAGAFTVTGSKVEFNGGAQTIPAFTFNDLVLSGSGAKTIPTATTVSVNEIDILNGPTLDIEGTAAINITKP